MWRFHCTCIKHDHNRADKMTGYKKYKVSISYIMQQLDLPLRSKGTLKHETALLLLSPFSTGVN